MKTNDNQHYIYLRSTHERIPCTEQEFHEYYRDIDTFRKKQQRHGRCVCPAAKRLDCDMDCVTCPFSRAGDTLSLDYTATNDKGDEKSWLDDMPDMPDKRNGQIIYSYKPLPYAEDAIYRKISDITISMKSTDHLQMPELVSSEYVVRLSDSEQEDYEDLKRELVLTIPDGEITAANAASLSGKLSQLANGAIYDDSGDAHNIHDRKLDALEDIIEAANGNPVLVAYWFKHDYDRISERLKKFHIPFSKLDTSDSIRRWNNGEIPVALIHPASAGHGLNLQSGGSTLVWFGLTWSLELYQQTVARLWRQGQTSKTVVVQHIITKGTIDERIMKALRNKERTQSALIDAVKADLKI